MHYLCKYRVILQNGDSFEGISECIMNNDGTVSYDYIQGVIKGSDGVLQEGSLINNLWNGRANFKWENGDREISEMVNDKRHGPSKFYYFDGRVNKEYYLNGEKIFLL